MRGSGHDRGDQRGQRDQAIRRRPRTGGRQLRRGREHRHRSARPTTVRARPPPFRSAPGRIGRPPAMCRSSANRRSRTRKCSTRSASSRKASATPTSRSGRAGPPAPGCTRTGTLSWPTSCSRSSPCRWTRGVQAVSRHALGRRHHLRPGVNVAELPRTVLLSTRPHRRGQRPAGARGAHSRRRILLAGPADDLHGRAVTVTDPTSAVDQFAAPHDELHREQPGGVSRVMVVAVGAAAFLLTWQ